MLTYDINHRGNQSIYEYLYQSIRRDILEGKLQQGEKLPSKRSLASHLNVGVITVANAYEQLLTEGYIRSVERKGYFVENLSRYNRKKAAAETDYPPEPPEREFFADFKANRIGLRHFPAATWNRFMREALSLHNDTLWKTIPYNGLYELRLAISDYLLQNRGMKVSPSQIIIGAGTEYLYSRLMQMFGRACTFGIEDPGYKKFAAISASFGNPWKYIPIDESGLMIDLLEDSGADVVHVSPANHFPTGTVMPITRRLELFEWVNRVRKRYIIEDDYDSEFRYASRPIPALGELDRTGRVVYVNTFAKSLAPGLRIGYLVLPNALMARYRERFSRYSSTVPSFDQHTLAAFMHTGGFERHISRSRKVYQARRDALMAALDRELADLPHEVSRSEAGLHLLLHMRNGMLEHELMERAKTVGVRVYPLSAYYTPPVKPPRATLVLGYAGLTEQQIDEAAKLLKQAWS